MEENTIKQAYENGLRSAGQVRLGGGVFLHHKDLETVDLSNEIRAGLKENAPGPENPTGHIRCETVEDLAKTVSFYSSDRTVIFACRDRLEIKAHFDYHQPGGDQTGWDQFCASTRFGLSKKVKQWKALESGVPQVGFAEFLEDHLLEVVSPSGQELLDIATDLEATSTGAFRSRTNLSNGSVRLEFSEETTTAVEVPQKISLGIPLFEHGDLFELSARLRFRQREGQLSFRVLLSNLDDAISDEFDRLVEHAGDLTKMTIIRGAV